jgi:hypothetical protein
VKTLKKQRPKSRWKDAPLTGVINYSDLAEDGHRLDADYYRAKKCLDRILQELRHDTLPSIDEFMEGVDFILDHPELIQEAIKAYK